MITVESPGQSAISEAASYDISERLIGAKFWSQRNNEKDGPNGEDTSTITLYRLVVEDQDDEIRKSPVVNLNNIIALRGKYSGADRQINSCIGAIIAPAKLKDCKVETVIMTEGLDALARIEIFDLLKPFAISERNFKLILSPDVCEKAQSIFALSEYSKFFNMPPVTTWFDSKRTSEKVAREAAELEITDFTAELDAALPATERAREILRFAYEIFQRHNKVPDLVIGIFTSGFGSGFVSTDPEFSFTEEALVAKISNISAEEFELFVQSVSAKDVKTAVKVLNPN